MVLARLWFMWKYLVAIGIWLLPPLAVCSLPFDAPGLTCLAMIYLYLGGLGLALGTFVLFFLTRKKAPAAAAFFLIVVIWLLAYAHGFTLGARIHLFVNEARYLAKIKQLSRATETERICGEECTAQSEPRIVVFHYCHCFLNWPDLVYDPHGALNGDREQLEKINPYLHGSSRLSTFWYIGYFGD